MTSPSTINEYRPRAEYRPGDPRFRHAQPKLIGRVWGPNQSGPRLTVMAEPGHRFQVEDQFEINFVIVANPITTAYTGLRRRFEIVETTRSRHDPRTAVVELIAIAPPIIGPGHHEQNVTALPADGAEIYGFDLPCGCGAIRIGENTRCPLCRDTLQRRAGGG